MLMVQFSLLEKRLRMSQHDLKRKIDGKTIVFTFGIPTVFQRPMLFFCQGMRFFSRRRICTKLYSMLDCTVDAIIVDIEQGRDRQLVLSGARFESPLFFRTARWVHAHLLI